MIATADEVNIALCKALGIDHEYVAAASMRLRAGEVAKIDVVRYITDEEANRLGTTIEHYHWAAESSDTEYLEAVTR